MTRKQKNIVIGLAATIVAAFSVLGAGASEGDNLNGDIGVSYRYRTDGDQVDQDAIESIAVDYFRPWKVFGPGAEIGFVVFGALQEDLDSEEAQVPSHSRGRPCSTCHSDGRGPGKFRFTEAADNFDNSFATRLYLAYAELNTRGFLKTLRIGRQDALEIAPVAFDGALATVKVAKPLYLTALGGQPVNMYEDWEDKQNDYLAGGYLTLQASRNLSMLAGYLAIHDEIVHIVGPVEKLDESLIFGRINWRPAREAALTAQITALENGVRDVSGRLSYFNTRLDFRINAGYLYQPLKREAEPLTTDPYSIILGACEPYHSGSLMFYKGFGEHFGFEAGGAFKELLDTNDESTYNHSFQRYVATAYLYKFPTSGTTISGGADYWISDGKINTIDNEGYHAEASQKLGQRVELRLGSQYFVYKIDMITGVEKEEVQTYYAGAAVRVYRGLSAKLDYTFEDGDTTQADIGEAKLNYEF